MISLKLSQFLIKNPLKTGTTITVTIYKYYKKGLPNLRVFKNMYKNNRIASLLPSQTIK